MTIDSTLTLGDVSLPAVDAGAGADSSQKKQRKPKAAAKGGAQGGKKDGKGKGKWEAYSGPEGSGNGYRLNVKNLSNETNSPDALRVLFGQYGSVVDAQVKARDDGSSKGFGFVIMGDEEQAQKAMDALDGKQIGGKSLSVQPASRRTPAEAEAAGKGKGKGKSKARPGEDALGGLDPNAMQMMLQISALSSQQQFMQQMMQAFSHSLPLQENPLLGGAYGAANPYANPYASAGLGGFPAVSPAAAAAAAPGQFYGKLKSTSSKNGYGFIECQATYEQFERDVYVDIHLLPKDAKPGAFLAFSITVNAKNQPKATQVEYADSYAHADPLAAGMY